MNYLKKTTTPNKLLMSKWTAVAPVNKEKHFIVSKLVMPDLPMQMIEQVELEAVHSKRCVLIDWQQLNDLNIWSQGWI